MVRLKQFCFADGEAIRYEGVECPMWGIGRDADAAGARQWETLRAG